MKKWKSPQGWEEYGVSTVLNFRSSHVNPSRHPLETFELYSMPAYDLEQKPEIIQGSMIGSSKKRVLPKDVLFSRLNPRIPRVWVAENGKKSLRKLASTDFVVLVDRLRPDGTPWFEAKFLRYQLLSSYFRGQIIDQVQGATGSRQRLRTEQIKAAKLRVPSLTMQRYIVTQIEWHFAELREMQALNREVKKDTERVMDAFLQKTLSELLVTHNCYTIKELKRRNLLRITGGGTPSKQKHEYWIGSIPWVSPKEMKTWIIEDTQNHITPVAIQNSSAKRIKRGSVLVVVRGMILARTWPVAIAGLDLTTNQDIKALIPQEGLIGKYLGYMLRALTPYVLTLVDTAAHGTKRLKTEVLEALKIPLPPKREQQYIVASLEAIESDLKVMQETPAQNERILEEVEQMILAKAFRGEL